MKLAELARSLGVALPPALVATWLLTRDGAPPVTLFTWEALGASVALSTGLSLVTSARLARRLGTISSVLAAFRDGDFSARARAQPGDSILVETIDELNLLGGGLRDQRLGSLESWALVRKVMAELDAVVLAFDERGHLRLANDAAARALGRPAPRLLGETAADLGIEGLLTGPAPRILREGLPAVGGSWELRRGQFRLSGAPHTLVVLADLRGALRAQEREAWKRLVRVMGHEINNSLAPIQSIAQNLQTLFARPERPADWAEDVESGLSVVARRAEALGRFMNGYAELARLPPPRLARVDVARWIERVVALEQRLAVEIVPGPDVEIDGDADQLDQLLINLVKNAVEATLETNRVAVRVRWELRGESCVVLVLDEGPGVAASANLFVPFFTTKTAGSGIGLALSREIAEAHGGDVTLRSREGATGAEAQVTLPLRA
jgi:nitrogen fixation/metabolism regulation signal transduction histidine kinase